MSLSPEEYREHLATTAVRAGFSFGEVVLPQSHEFHLGRMRFHYLDWGNKHLPTIIFLHYWGKGPADKLANGFKAALNELGKGTGKSN